MNLINGEPILPGSGPVVCGPRYEQGCSQHCSCSLLKLLCSMQCSLRLCYWVLRLQWDTIAYVRMYEHEVTARGCNSQGGGKRMHASVALVHRSFAQNDKRRDCHCCKESINLQKMQALLTFLSFCPMLHEYTADISQSHNTRIVWPVPLRWGRLSNRRNGRFWGNGSCGIAQK